MGQRSQIYIYWNIQNPYKKEERQIGMIARYFQWNYGQFMVSRCRAILDFLHYQCVENYYGFDDTVVEKLHRLCDVNFDTRSIVLSTDIWEEIHSLDDDMSCLFNQDNNDGQLFIEVTDAGIKYSFNEYQKNGRPMSATQYMAWDAGRDWRQKISAYDTEYTQNNLSAIPKLARLMSEEERDRFIDRDYSEFLFCQNKIVSAVQE